MKKKNFNAVYNEGRMRRIGVVIESVRKYICDKGFLGPFFIVMSDPEENTLNYRTIAIPPGEPDFLSLGREASKQGDEESMEVFMSFFQGLAKIMTEKESQIPENVDLIRDESARPVVVVTVYDRKTRIGSSAILNIVYDNSGKLSDLRYDIVSVSDGFPEGSNSLIDFTEGYFGG